MKEYYVILTGAYDNVGDFLIRDRAKKLLSLHRPDRDLVEWSRREHFDEEKIEIANQAKAILLTGGPSLQSSLYPKIFPLCDIERLSAPIILYGAGWKGGGGTWQHETKYTFTSSSKTLLKRLSNENFNHSVRDYHTLRVLNANGLSNIIMTGCPVLYGKKCQENMNIEPDIPVSISKIVISAGVQFIKNPDIGLQLINLINSLTCLFENPSLEVLFHHSIDREKQEKAYGSARDIFIAKHKELIKSIHSETMATTRVISGNLQHMIDAYSSADLHVGYRVHAHALMSSIGKPSYLIAEDGRGTGMAALTGQQRMVVGFETTTGKRKLSFSERALRKIGRKQLRSVKGEFNSQAVSTITGIMRYEQRYNYPLTRNACVDLNKHLPYMEKFLMGLP